MRNIFYVISILLARTEKILKRKNIVWTKKWYAVCLCLCCVPLKVFEGLRRILLRLPENLRFLYFFAELVMCASVTGVPNS